MELPLQPSLIPLLAEITQNKPFYYSSGKQTLEGKHD